MSLPDAAPAIAAPLKKPAHRLPDGRTTSGAGAAAAAALLRGPAPNTAVKAAWPNQQGLVGISSNTNRTIAGFEVDPPDLGLAVHGAFAIEVVNDVIRIFDPTTNRGWMTKSLSAFFGDPASCGDPQAFYDQTIDRWIITQLRSSLCATGMMDTEGFDIAVSKTRSVTDGFWIYSVRAFSSDISGCGGYDCFPDYPKAGYDLRGFYISVNLFSATGVGSFVKAATYALSKDGLTFGKGTVNTARIVYPGDFVVQPSVPAPGQPYVTDAGGTEYLLEARGSGTVRVWAISNTKSLYDPKNGMPSAYGVDVATQAYGGAVNSTEPKMPALVCKSNGRAAPSLDGGYTAFQATVQWANNELFAALPAGASDANGLARNTIAWFALQPAVKATGVPGAVVIAQGTVVPPAGYSISYPAMAVDNTGHGVIGMTIVNNSNGVPGDYPSAAVLPFTGHGTDSWITVTGPGVTSDGGISGCGGFSHVGRWGDYGAAVIDSGTGYFYTASENISGESGAISNWGTVITPWH